MDSSKRGSGKKFRIRGKEVRPDTFSFNFYDGTYQYYRKFIWDNLGAVHYGLEDYSYSPLLAKQWRYDADSLSFSVSLKESTWWHNDEPVTSADLRAKYLLDFATGRFPFERIDRFEFDLVNERTLRLNLPSQVNEAALLQGLITNKLSTPYSTYEPLVERVADSLRDDEALNRLSREIREFDVSKPIGNSLFKFEEIREGVIHATLHRGHWAAKRYMNAGDFDVTFEQDGPANWRMKTTEQSAEESSSARPEDVWSYQHPAGLALSFNQNREPWGKREVRQALCYALDRNRIAERAGDGAHPDEYITGISILEDAFLSEIIDRYPKYEFDREKAASLLRNAGLQRKDGYWRYGGKLLDFEIHVCGKNRTFVRGGREIVDQLREFGFETGLRVVESQNRYNELRDDAAYDLSIYYWGGWGPYPDNGLNFEMTGSINEGYRGARPTPDSPARVRGEVAVPMPVGEWEGDRDPIRPPELVDELRSTVDEDRQRAIVQTLAWTYAVTLPRVPLLEREVEKHLPRDRFDLPANITEDHPDVSDSLLTLWKAGLLRPKIHAERG